jgi:GntR family transcriptional repressor for pyruvate dehydrogenase complex
MPDPIPLSALPPRGTAVDSCEATLQAHLLSGAVRPGEHLPPERALAEQLGVDRGTLRPAISRLVTQGLLTQRQGRGTVVTDVREAGGLDLLAPIVDVAVHAKDDRAVVAIAKDLLRLRRHLASALLESLIDKGPASSSAIAVVNERIEALRVALEKHGDAVDDVSAAVLSDADVAVLSAVVAAADSVVWSLALNPVKKALQACPPLRRAIADDLGESVFGWGVVAAFLAAPNAAVAAAIMAALAERDERTLGRLSTSSKSSKATSKSKTKTPSTRPTRSS